MITTIDTSDNSSEIVNNNRRLARLAMVALAAVATLMMELLFVGYRRLPLASGYVPSVDLKSRGPAYVAGVLCLSFGLAWIERSVLESVSAYVILLASVAGPGAGLAVFDRAGQ